METHCRLCGLVMPESPVWSAEYLKHKTPTHSEPWICPTCEAKVRREAIGQSGLDATSS